MLVGVIRVGALRQRVEKGFAMVGSPRAQPQLQADAKAKAQPQEASRATRGSGADAAHRVVLTAVHGQPGLWSARTPMRWLGSVDARQQWAESLVSAVAGAARTMHASILPTGTTGRLDGKPFATPYGEDRHVLEVASTAEQEVLCNLLREYAAVLIGLAGRSPSGNGSRRLAASREHVTTRYLHSASPAYLSRLASVLRRSDGLSGLHHMDVHPGTDPDGTLTVQVRCIDAAASAAATRAHALMLAALGLRARRLVRDGHRVGDTPQRRIDEDRARAVARGLQARLAVDATGAGRRRTYRPARAMLRALLAETLSIELDNLGATAEELFPVIAAVDLPGAGLTRLSCEDSVLAGYSARDPRRFPEVASRTLLDAAAGGPCLAQARQIAPGRTRLLLDAWGATIAERRGGTR